jgi:hypothetical protein
MFVNVALQVRAEIGLPCTLPRLKRSMKQKYCSDVIFFGRNRVFVQVSSHVGAEIGL